MKEKQYKISYTIILFLTLLPALAAETKTRTVSISGQEASWSTVISGEAVCPPQQTSYGFAVLTDGRMISACTESGTVLWQRAVPGKPDPFITVLDGDFLVTINDSQTLSLTNPSGLTLWSVRIPFQISAAPSEGRDGRIFVCGRENIACYGIKGICKWCITTDEQSSIPLQELPDGSLVAFLSQPVNQKTAAIRISPFGEILERITFAGTVASAASCSQGILLTFSGGGAGLCTLKDGREVDTAWALSADNSLFAGNSGSGSSVFLPLSPDLAALVQPSSGSAKITFFTIADGKITSSSTIPRINVTKLIYKAAYDNGFLLAGADRASYISSDGSCIWSADLPDMNSTRQAWNYLTYTPGGYLIFCRTSWAVAGYRVMQNIHTNHATGNKTVKPDYSAFIKRSSSYFDIYAISGQLENGLSGRDRLVELQRGMYGKKETKWTRQISDASRSYLSVLRSSNTGGRTASSVFSADITGTDNMLRQLSYYGTSAFPPLIAQLITAENTNTHMHTLLAAAADCAYDPDGSLLDSLDSALFKIPAGNDFLLSALCDAVYSICRFMGRPAFYLHGKDILTKLMYPQYSNTIHEYARNTLIHIAKLKI
jgi:hypothetical protein